MTAAAAGGVGDVAGAGSAGTLTVISVVGFESLPGVVGRVSRRRRRGGGDRWWRAPASRRGSSERSWRRRSGRRSSRRWSGVVVAGARRRRCRRRGRRRVGGGRRRRRVVSARWAAASSRSVVVPSVGSTAAGDALPSAGDVAAARDDVPPVVSWSSAGRSGLAARVGRRGRRCRATRSGRVVGGGRACDRERRDDAAEQRKQQRCAVRPTDPRPDLHSHRHPPITRSHISIYQPARPDTTSRASLTIRAELYGRGGGTFLRGKLACSRVEKGAVWGQRPAQDVVAP